MMFDIYVVSAFMILVLFSTWLLFVRYPEKRCRRLSDEPERRYEQSIQQIEAQYISVNHKQR